MESLQMLRMEDLEQLLMLAEGRRITPNLLPSRPTIPRGVFINPQQSEVQQQQQQQQVAGSAYQQGLQQVIEEIKTENRINFTEIPGPSHQVQQQPTTAFEMRPLPSDLTFPSPINLPIHPNPSFNLPTNNLSVSFPNSPLNFPNSPLNLPHSSVSLPNSPLNIPQPTNPTLNQNPNTSPYHSSSSSSSDDDECQDLFNEMEEFLSSQSPQQMPNPTSSSTSPTPGPSTSSNLNPAEMQDAEEIVDALVSGDLPLSPMDDQSKLQMVRESVSVDSRSISNVSETVTKDGQRVLIVFANEQQQQQQQQLMSPSSNSSWSDDSSDPEWQPSSPEQSRSSPKPSTSKSKGGVTKRRPTKASGYNLKDKRERKKLQNVVAARKYRDRKKSEQYVLEKEEEDLLEVNRGLRDRCAEVEGEVRTLKKLMVELGLVKITESGEVKK